MRREAFADHSAFGVVIVEADRVVAVMERAERIVESHQRGGVSVKRGDQVVDRHDQFESHVAVVIDERLLRVEIVADQQFSNGEESVIISRSDAIK